VEDYKKLNFVPRVYESNNVLDRTFKEFGQKDVESEKTVEQFFLDYDDLYFLIPASGETGSHQYLIEQSSKLYSLTGSMDDIQPLLDEITLLRSQSLANQQTIIELSQKLAEISAANK